MVQLTKEQHVFIVLHHTHTGNTTVVQNAFRARFPAQRKIVKNFEKYSNEGTSLNLNKDNSGRRRTARSVENIAAVSRALFEQNQRNVSARPNPILLKSHLQALIG